MKKLLVISIVTILALLLTYVGASADPPQEPKQINCDQFIAVYLSDPEPHWRGTLSGCALDGAAVHYWGQPESWESGYVLHFHEHFEIYPQGGGYIKGYDDGLWNYSTWKFRAEGRVTEASPEWSYLIGYKFHEMGTTDDPWLPGWEILNGPSTMFLHGP